MINRIIFNDKVYYKKKDLKDLFEINDYKLNKIIKEQNIPTTILKGFGRTVWIEEKYVSSINIDGVYIKMQTKLYDYQTRLHENLKMKSFINALVSMNYQREIKTDIELQEEVIKETEKEFEPTELKEDKEQITNGMINNLLEQEGYEERIYTAELKCDDKVFGLDFMFRNGEIFTDSHKYYMTTDIENLRYTKKDIKQGKVLDYDGRNDEDITVIEFTKGEHKIVTPEIFLSALQKLLKGTMKKDSTDYTNFNDVCLSDDMVLSMINSKEVILCNLEYPNEPIPQYIDIVEDEDIIVIDNNDIKTIDDNVEDELQNILDIDEDIEIFNKELEELEEEQSSTIIEEDLKIAEKIILEHGHIEEEIYMYEDYEPLQNPAFEYRNY